MGERILVVEDDEKSRRLLRDVLSHHGFDVSDSETGEAALLLARERPPRAALVDIFLPGMNGYDQYAPAGDRGHRFGDGARPGAHARLGIRRVHFQTG
jgi:DNA-binding NtrC family response regulator